MITGPTVVLRRDKQRSIQRRHPWIFSGAVEKVVGSPEPGDLVRVLSAEGEFLAWGHYSPASQIRVRLLEWEESVKVDEGWFGTRLAASVARRQRLGQIAGTTAYRLVHGEADFLPGLVVDRYDDVLVLQASSAGADRIKSMTARILADEAGVPCVYERSDVKSRKQEGLPPSEGPLLGSVPSNPFQILENGQKFLVDVAGGQKTGAYLDQRENRKRAALQAAGRDVLDAFCYTGWFACAALVGGADRVTLVDSSAPALALAAENLELNGQRGRTRLVEDDVFSCLRSFRNEGRTFDMIFLDPPKLAPTRAHAKKASRAYKDLNLLAMKLLVPDGVLATFSCSAGMDAAFFQEVLSWAAADAGREVQVVERMGQAFDHPVRLSFPESEYLKGFICRVI